MNLKKSLLFIGILFLVLVTSVINSKITLNLIHNTIERPIINEIALTGLAFHESSYESMRSEILKRIDEKINFSFQDFDENTEESYLLSLRKEFNENFSKLNDGYMIAYPTLFSFYEILGLSHLYLSKMDKTRIDDIICKTLSDSFLVTINKNFDFWIKNEYDIMCNRRNQECNHEFLEKITRLNILLEENISRLPNSPKLSEKMEKCSQYRAYLYSQFMEEKLKEYIKKVMLIQSAD